jgi:hypothetical protein
MILTKWLVTNRNGTSRLVGSKPYLKADEIAIYLEIQIPSGLFDKPRLVANIKIPESAVPAKEITAEVTDNIEEAIRTATGLEMRVSVVAAPSEDEDE